MGYYADAERNYDPENAPIARWTKRDKMTADDIVPILEDFINQAESGGKDYQFLSAQLGAPASVRLSHPGTPSYEHTSFMLAGEPGYGEDSIIKFDLGFGTRYYLVDLSDPQKSEQQLQNAAQDMYTSLLGWDTLQAQAEEGEEGEED